MDKKEHKVWIEDSCWIQAPLYALYISHLTTRHIQGQGKDYNGKVSWQIKKNLVARWEILSKNNAVLLVKGNYKLMRMHLCIFSCSKRLTIRWADWRINSHFDFPKRKDQYLFFFTFCSGELLYRYVVMSQLKNLQFTEGNVYNVSNWKFQRYIMII